MEYFKFYFSKVCLTKRFCYNKFLIFPCNLIRTADRVPQNKILIIPIISKSKIVNHFTLKGKKILFTKIQQWNLCKNSLVLLIYWFNDWILTKVGVLVTLLSHPGLVHVRLCLSLLEIKWMENFKEPRKIFKLQVKFTF